MDTSIAQWIATAVVAGGLVYTIRRNGRNNKESDTRLKTELTMELRSIKERLDNPQEGLGAIKRELSDMKQHCAAVTSTFSEKIAHAEAELKKRKD